MVLAAVSAAIAACVLNTDPTQPEGGHRPQQSNAHCRDETTTVASPVAAAASAKRV